VTGLSLRKPTDVHQQIQGGGVLFSAQLSSLDGLIPLLRREDQTLTHFGLSQSTLESFARLANGRGIDRIVPIGQALDFGHIWDGFDLISSMTRMVVIS
jgi:hypothetical protein